MFSSSPFCLDLATSHVGGLMKPLTQEKVMRIVL